MWFLVCAEAVESNIVKLETSRSVILSQIGCSQPTRAYLLVLFFSWAIPGLFFIFVISIQLMIQLIGSE